MAEKTYPAIEALRARFDYQADGNLVWRSRPLNTFKTPRAMATWNSRYAGTVAGAIDGKGYLQIAVDGQLYRGHRLIWAVVTGAHPVNLIDHKDGDKTNNRIENLREATRQHNSVNSAMAQGAGRRGTYFVQRLGKYAAQIKADGQWFWLGLHDTEDAAFEAYRSMHEIFWGEYSCTEASRG